MSKDTLFLCERSSRNTPPCEEAFQLTDKVWALNISDLAELRTFVEKYGECVISKEGEFLSIEIYDSFRE